MNDQDLPDLTYYAEPESGSPAFQPGIYRVVDSLGNNIGEVEVMPPEPVDMFPNGVTKFGMRLPLSNEMIREPTFTEEDQARWAAQREREAEYRQLLTTRLAEAAEPILSIGRLHAPVTREYYQSVVCEGCDMDGGECESPEWPCRTAVLLGDILGVHAPKGMR